MRGTVGRTSSPLRRVTTVRSQRLHEPKGAGACKGMPFGNDGVMSATPSFLT
jgi:hypothetical protein